MSTLAAIRQRRTEISRQIEHLRGEDEKLSIAEQVIIGLDVADHSPIKHLPVEKARGAPRFHRDLILDAMLHSDAVWVRSSEIIELVRRRWGSEIPARSLRPLLSLMKKDGLIVRQGRVLAHPSRLKNEPSKRERASEMTSKRAVS